MLSSMDMSRLRLARNCRSHSILHGALTLTATILPVNECAECLLIVAADGSCFDSLNAVASEGQ